MEVTLQDASLLFGVIAGLATAIHFLVIRPLRVSIDSLNGNITSLVVRLEHLEARLTELHVGKVSWDSFDLLREQVQRQAVECARRHGGS